MVSARAAFVTVALALTLTSAASASESRARFGRVEAVVWTPETAAGAERWPVVLFSHGLLMCPSQARYITRALAAAGYFVVAPLHADSYCGDTTMDLPDVSRLPLKPSMLWSDSDYRDRAGDMQALVAALREDHALGARVDADRIALVGHSLGGYTVLGLGGAWPSWSLPGVLAIVAYVPYVMPFLGSDGLSRLNAPVMFQGGTQDPTFTVPLWVDGGAYQRAPSPKVLVEIDGAAHLAWTDLGVSGREAIVSCTVAFLDRYVKGAPESAPRVACIDGVAELRSDPPSRNASAHADRGSAPTAYAAATAAVRDWITRARGWLSVFQ
jgi:predicted dienelactone hydrolase